MNVKGFIQQGAFYLFAGGSSALIELGLFQLLYTLFGLNPAVSNLIAVPIATIYNFCVNRNLTFKSTSDPRLSAIRYLILFLANLAITTTAIAFMINVGVNSVLAKIIMQICVVIWNFFIYRCFVFR